ncbi:hypothetical protein [Aquimarina algiphila]|uniref:hypothetical protein n=1 Tax=Aquimarina algiphila TaxID=2047982 RepID=UPI00232DAF8B|nr:hypothetical protein [Aquimarina algiphila]
MSGTIIKTGEIITKTAEKIMLNATNGDIILNAAKSVVISSDKEIVYNSYEAVEQEEKEDLLVKKVEGPTEVDVGKEYTFTAAEFSRKALPAELQNVKWAYQIDDGAIQYFNNPGKVIGGVVTKNIHIDENLWDNKTLKVYAYFQNPADDASVECEVKFVPIELLLIFYIDEDHKGNTLMAEVAQTRLKNIKNSDWYDSNIHKVHCPPIQSIDEIIKIVPKYYKKYGGKEKVVVKEIGVVSHSGGDGPISYETEIKICPIKDWPHQMDMCGWEQIELTWAKEDPICVFYGCNSGRKNNGFAMRISKLSNFRDVEVWGQSTSSFPSFYPDYRVTSLARSMGTGWDIRGHSYLVGGDGGKGWDATSYKPNKDTLDEETLKKDFPKANPMNCYKNGTHVRETHQGYFNDHRK